MPPLSNSHSDDPPIVQPTPKRLANGYQTGDLRESLDAQDVVLTISPAPMEMDQTNSQVPYSPIDLDGPDHTLRQ